MNRRNFLKGATGAMFGSVLGLPAAIASEEVALPEGHAMLIDTTECIGCRKCEWACAQENGLSDAPMEEFEDPAVFDTQRRMDATSYTIVNRYENPKDTETPIFVKDMCMHCLDPACVSACLVSALTRNDDGAVVYDQWKCIGCRYCMVACPFEVPAYEYNNALTPEVRKCVLCNRRFEEEGKIPACAEICPPMAITFGKREEILELAHRKIDENPDRYVDHVYGEHEVGGTSVLYLASQPFEELGLPKLGEQPIPKLTETIQHSIFKYGIPPLLALGVLGTAMRTLKDDEHEEDHATAARKEDES